MSRAENNTYRPLQGPPTSEGFFRSNQKNDRETPKTGEVIHRDPNTYPTVDSTPSGLVNMAFDKRSGTWNVNALQRIAVVGNDSDKKLALAQLEKIAQKAPDRPKAKKGEESHLLADQRSSAVSALGNIARGDTTEAAAAGKKLLALGAKGGVKTAAKAELVGVQAWKKRDEVAHPKTRDEVVLEGKIYTTVQAQLMLTRQRQNPKAVEEREELLAFKNGHEQSVEKPGNLLDNKASAKERAALDRMLARLPKDKTPADIVDRQLKTATRSTAYSKVVHAPQPRKALTIDPVKVFVAAERKLIKLREELDHLTKNPPKNPIQRKQWETEIALKKAEVKSQETINDRLVDKLNTKQTQRANNLLNN